MCERQKVLRISDATVLFSPVSDIGSMDCGGVMTQLQFKRGINIIPRLDCRIHTSELLILETTFPTAKITTLSMDDLSSDLTGLLSTLEDITVPEGLDLSNMTSDLNAYLTAEGKEQVDLSTVQQQLAKFRSIHKLANYSMFAFDFEQPDGLGDAVTGLYMIVGGILLAVLIASCCACCFCTSFRAAAVLALKIAGKIVYWVFWGLFWLISKISVWCYHRCKDKRRGMSHTSATAVDMEATFSGLDTNLHSVSSESAVNFSESELGLPIIWSPPTFAINRSAVIATARPAEVDLTFAPPPSLTPPILAALTPPTSSTLGSPEFQSTPEAYMIIGGSPLVTRHEQPPYWDISIERGCRATLFCQSPLGRIEWNDSLKIAEGEDGAEILGERPDPLTLRAWQMEVRQLPIPCASKIGDKWILRAYPNIEWDEGRSLFRDLQTGQVVSGFRRDAVYWDDVVAMLPHGPACSCLQGD
jgi:hypothetical protein